MTMSSTRDERWKMARETGSREEREKCRLTITTLALRRAGKREKERERKGKKGREKK